MSADSTESSHGRITFRVSKDRKREIRMRAAQKGHNTVTEYFHELVEEDLENVDLPLE